jgi:hypothetical protein
MGVFVRWPMTYNMSGLIMALQWHLWAPHVHGNNHVNILILAVVCYDFLHSYGEMLFSCVAHERSCSESDYACILFVRNNGKFPQSIC